MLDEKDRGFSESYVAGPSTAGAAEEAPKEETPAETAKIPVEQERYGTGKPTRKVVRAKIAAD